MFVSSQTMSCDSALFTSPFSAAKQDEGYFAVVGFPVIRDERYEWDCRGPMRLYEKTGFVKEAEQEGYIVMRNGLR